uniref:ORF6 n=1 Tax=Lentinula edodes negative-strand RNA virus 1 TaxID=2547430 RepID=A0A7S7C2Z3_9MONO|nr:ORF6 [Lentinula edodes negative-strand RNA virus 1]
MAFYSTVIGSDEYQTSSPTPLEVATADDLNGLSSSDSFWGIIVKPNQRFGYSIGYVNGSKEKRGLAQEDVTRSVLEIPGSFAVLIRGEPKRCGAAVSQTGGSYPVIEFFSLSGCKVSFMLPPFKRIYTIPASFEGLLTWVSDINEAHDRTLSQPGPSGSHRTAEWVPYPDLPGLVSGPIIGARALPGFETPEGAEDSLPSDDPPPYSP